MHQMSKVERLVLAVSIHLRFEIDMPTFIFHPNIIFLYNIKVGEGCTKAQSHQNGMQSNWPHCPQRLRQCHGLAINAATPTTHPKYDAWHAHGGRMENVPSIAKRRCEIVCRRRQQQRWPLVVVVVLIAHQLSMTGIGFVRGVTILMIRRSRGVGPVR